MLGAYLLEPERRSYELHELAADAGIGGGGPSPRARTRASSWPWAEEGEAGSTPPRRPGSSSSWREPARPARGVGLDRLLREVELPLIHVLAAMEREGLKLDVERLAEIGSGIEEQVDAARGRDPRPRRARLHDRLPAAGGPGPVRGARPDPEAPRQDRVLDRRAGPRPDPRRAPDRREDRDLAGADQAEEHLPGHAPRPGRPRERPDPHDLQPGRHHHRAPLEHQPEPPEHPDPDRDRAPGAGLLRRRAGCDCSRPTTARSSCASWPTSPRRRC